MASKGKWIYVTGIDGAGKTTIAKHLASTLHGRNEYVHFPYYDWLRDMLKISGDNVPGKDPVTDFLLLAASSRIDDYVLRDMLMRNDHVVSQRGWLDIYPYHFSRGFTYAKIDDILRPGDLARPDVLIFLDCDYRKAYDWIKHSHGDKFERRDLLRVHQRNFYGLLDRIRSGKLSVDLGGMEIIIQDSSGPWPAVKRELKKKLLNIGIR